MLPSRSADGRRRRSGAATGLLISHLIPGIGRVQAQVLPFAEAWEASNTAALRRTGPLWVALGDSISQGIGARDISGGWVSQLHAQLSAAGTDLRLVNLSVTGARVEDVLTQQLPRLTDLGAIPQLVTVLVGANDMLVRSRPAAAVSHFAHLIEALGRFPAVVVATLPRRNPKASAINALIEEAAAAGKFKVADLSDLTLRSLRGTRADDYFHPNERGYATVSAAFAHTLGMPPPTAR